MKKNISIIYFLLFVYSIANAQDSLYFRANAYKEQLDNYYSMDEKDFPKPGSILFIGSSSLGMWKNTGSYFPNHRVLNRAYGGSWISDYLYHYQRLVVAYKPAQIVLLCGAIFIMAYPSNVFSKTLSASAVYWIFIFLAFRLFSFLFIHPLLCPTGFQRKER